MNRFRYRAARQDGRVVSGILAATTGAEVDALLLTQGLQPLSSDPIAGTPMWRRAVSRRDLAIVFRSLATLVAAGMPIARALTATEALPRNAALCQTLVDTRRLLVEGKSLSDALLQADGMIPPVVLGMLRAGERGSRLAPALEQVAAQLEQEAELAGRMQQALAYPIVLLAAGTVSLGVITTVVVPRFADILADLGQALPPATRALLAVTGVVRDHGFIGGVGMAMGIAVFLTWIATSEGRRQLHRVLLTWPVIGPIRHGFATARVSRALGGLLASGVPILGAIAAARQAAGDAAVEERLERVATRISKGEPVATSLAAERALTPVALQIVAVGEPSGQLSGMAIRAGDIAAMDAERGLRTLVSLLEPGLVILFGGLVAFTAAALLQAVYSLRPV